MRNSSSQKFVILPSQNETRIARTDYPGDEKCSGMFPMDYDIVGRCYSLYDAQAPRSFSWTAHRRTVGLSGARPASPAPPLPLLLALLWA